MNICVVNGSPRGENSLTLQTTLYLEKRYPEHNFVILPAAAAIHRLERDFSEAVTALEAADLILFSYPVYTFLVPSQLTRFVELLKESDADLRGKYVSPISTSKHFYDVTAHRFLEARAEAGSNYLAGIADDSGQITTRFLAENLAYALAHDFTKPQNFYGIGGMKIFRDLIYKMQGMMKADHKFYKAHGIYDFPQNEKGTIAAMYLVGLMFSNPKIKKALGDKINEGMAAPYKKVIDAASPK